MSERSEIWKQLKERELDSEFKWPGFDVDEAKAKIKKHDLFESVEEDETQDDPVEELDEAELICDNCGDSFVPDNTPYKCSFGHIQCQECGDVCKSCPTEDEIIHYINEDGCPCGANNDNNDLSATPEIDDVNCDGCLVILENSDEDEEPECFGEFNGESEKCGKCPIRIASDCETQTKDDEVLFIAVKENKTVEEVIEETQDDPVEESKEVSAEIKPVAKIPKKKPKKIIPKKKRYFKPKKKSDNPYDIAKRLLK